MLTPAEKLKGISSLLRASMKKCEKKKPSANASYCSLCLQCLYVLYMN